MSQKIDKLIAAALLETPPMDLVCHLGNDSGIRRIEFKDYWVARERLIRQPDGRYRQRLTNPLRAGPPSPHTMFPEAYYTALEWLEAHQGVLQERVCALWNYPAKREQYLPGNEAGLVVDLSDALKDVVGDQVDPVLVSAVLFRLGLDQFCSDYKSTPHSVPATNREWRGVRPSASSSTLATAVRLDPANVDANFSYASELLRQGDWQAAIPFYEKTLDLRPNHVAALNDLACILSEYEIDTKKALDYAKTALRLTPEGGHRSSDILDTVGWAYFKHGRNSREAEKHLREALKTRSPYAEYHVTTVFHLLVVLKDLGKHEEARDLYRMLLSSTPRTLLDSQNYAKAQALMEELESR